MASIFNHNRKSYCHIACLRHHNKTRSYNFLYFKCLKITKQNVVFQDINWELQVLRYFKEHKFLSTAFYNNILV